MAVQCVATAASQLINTSTNIALPVQNPGYPSNSFSVNVWINSNWGTSAAPRGRKSFVGIYGPVQVTQGTTATYYNNKTLTEPYYTKQTDAQINLAGSNTTLPSAIPAGTVGWSVRWTGYFVPPTTGVYYFRTTSDDGIRATINSVQVINNFTDHSSTVDTSTVANRLSLTAGVAVPLLVEFYDQGGDYIAQLQYGIGTATAVATTFTTIPQSMFQTSATPTSSMTALQIGTTTGSGEISCWTYGGQLMVTTVNDYAPASNGSWINVCYTWDGTNSLLYVNGVLAASNATTLQIPGILKYVVINGYYGGGTTEVDNHYVDVYMLYNRVLVPNEILTMYDAYGARHGIWNGLVAYYEFDEGADGTNASTILDYTGQGATLLMTPTTGGTNPKYAYNNVRSTANIRPPSTA